jgi:glycolate oxidase FAD binding subunit
MLAESIATLAQGLAEIVGSAHVREADSNDAIDLVIPRLVVAPGNAEEVASTLKFAMQAGAAVIPRGGATKRGWGNRPAAAAIVLETGRLAAIVEHAWGDMTATAQAGCTIGALQQTLAEHGQRLASDPLWPERATVGGVLATNDSGALRVRYGGLRDQIIGMTVALADGTLAKSGGKVVKNVAGYDLPKLMTGALGTLGVIVEATFRLYPLPQATQDVSVRLPDLATAGKLILAINDSVLAPGAVQLRVGTDMPPQVDVRFEGLAHALAIQAEQLVALAGARSTDHDATDWGARAALWHGAEPALVCKVSVLPADLAMVCGRIEDVARPLKLRWRFVTNSLGVGMLRLEGANEEALLAALVRLRTDLGGLGGTLALLGCPAGIKSRVEVWGEAGDALALMGRVKRRFDPGRVLNPGRFVGRI